ncbi:ABC-F family ATP-binding cassette domain-containing protein [Erysipelothrix sp. HDW6C]|uniref:ribosomal protection-like ABC-F family protein n=1 Tax=Erysipelothrix sp. HDW6C TaxID=2714930 RepID=UPI00140785AC|nr:ABC-F family ATP-binding cassette domain-containing protein [Erysipelothrix sp. HDW6C]QIK68862.1 ABC-F family ATP-binding cassette domain-containing protein [Erysipelothrix sp. HDW6C]
MKIRINQITKKYAGDIVIDALNFEILKGSKIAIVGENGVGKSTLLKIIAGLETIESGDVIVPKEMRVQYMQQIFPTYTGGVRAYLSSQFKELHQLSEKLVQLSDAMSTEADVEKLLIQYGKVQSQFESQGGYEFENNVDRICKGLGIFQHLDKPYISLSGGEKTRIELAKCLLADAEVLCLDEPTNHLDFEGIAWLEQFCQASAKTIVLVSHDRKFIANVVTSIHEIEDGKLISYMGDYDYYRKEKQERFVRLVDDYKEQQKQIQKLQLAIRRYRQWGNESDNEDFYKKAKMLERRLEKIQRVPKPVELRNRLDITLDASIRSGEEVIIANDLSVGYDKPISSENSFRVKWQDRFAIVGKNGSGKSTLIKTLLGELPPLAGTVVIGPSVKVGYLPQQIMFPNQKERILQYVMHTCVLSEETARRYLVKFGFYQEDTYKPLHYLSGGERVRLKLLEILLSDVNLLILDEPTNHLDITSCEIIEQLVSEYQGTLVVVSHDRYFLESINARQYQLNVKATDSQ